MSVKKLILPAVAVTALVGGVAGYFYFNGAPGDTATPLGIAKVIPEKAYLAAFISTDEKNWAKLRQFGTPEAQQAYEKSLKEFRQKMLSESNVDVDKDVKPWMGNMMVAMMPSPNAKEPEMLVAIAIKDKVSALSFANKLKSDAKATTTETDYKGVKIAEIVDAKSKNPSYAAVLKDSYLVVGSDKKAIEQSIDTLQGSPSFATKQEAAPLLSQNDGEAVVARLYLPDYAGMVKAISASSSMPMNASTLEQLKSVKSMVSTVSIDDVGLRLKGAMKFDPKTAIELKPSSSKVAAQFPIDTFALVSGANLSSYWSQNVAQAKNIPESKKFIDMMRGGTQTAGLDLDTDIFSWMDGEFAIGMMPISQGPLAQMGVGGAMVFTTSDRKTAEATLSKLDAIGTSQSLTIAQREVNGKKVTEWQTPQGGLLGHGWLDDHTLFIALGDQLVTSLSSQPNPSLEASDNFKAVTASLPKQNFGYFYVDVEKTMALVNKATGGSQKLAMNPETTAIMNSIKGVGGTTIQTDKTTRQIEAVLALKPAK
jgi:hypothetical protein